MVGLSHAAFRELVRLYTPFPLHPVLFTEMLSTRRIPSERLDQAEALRVSPLEGRFVPQLLGNEEEFISASIQRLLPLRPWGFDINMGCPMKKTLSHNWGVRLLGDVEYAGKVVAMTKRHSPVPVSVKLRSGQNDCTDLDFLLEFTSKLERAGADWLTVHCRPPARKHSGQADWETVARVRTERGIPVVVNGDLQTAADAMTVVRDLEVDGVMFGRAATARPWVLWQLGHALGFPECEGHPPSTPDEEGAEYFRAVYRLCNLLESHYGEGPSALQRLWLYVGISHRWLFYGHLFWTMVRRARTLDEARDCISDFGARYPQPMVSRVSW